jgi:hypothetical protein
METNFIRRAIDAVNKSGAIFKTSVSPRAKHWQLITNSASIQIFG